MRVSIDPDDQGFIPQESQRRCKVVLDGIRQRKVLTADEEAGVVVRYVCHPNGALKVKDGSLVVEEVLGDVKIIFGD